MKIKISKVKSINPASKKQGVAARVITNGTATFDQLCNEAAHNTTAHKSEVRMGFELGLEEAAKQLKAGMIVDLGPLGKLYPACTSGWFEKAEDMTMDAVKTHVNYAPSDDIKAAIAGASLSWAKAGEAEDEEQKPAAPGDEDDSIIE